MRGPAFLVLVATMLLASGCVVSETERGPGPGDQKKSSDAVPAPPPGEAQRR